MREAELVAVGVGQLDGAVPGAAEPGRPQRDQSVDLGCQVAVGRARSKRCRFLPCFGATGGPPHATLVPPCGDWTAVSWSWSHTRGQPSASAQKSPTCRVPSQASSPRKPQPAKKELPGSITQNSLPSGSASTMCSSSGSWPTSRWPAPSSSAAATVPCCPARLVLVRWRCTRFGPAFSAPLGVNRRPTWLSDPGSRAPRRSSTTSRPRTPAQKPARRAGSCASKVRASSREGIRRTLVAGEELPHAVFRSAVDATSYDVTRYSSARSRPTPHQRTSWIMFMSAGP